MTVPAAVPPARDAATVVLVRDGPSGLETLLLRRTPAARFVPGMHVFPGGVVDPGDGDAVSRLPGISPAEADALTGAPGSGRAFWVAAVRESLEEAGVSPGVVRSAATAHGAGRPGTQPPGAREAARCVAADLSAWRGPLHRGERTMASVLAEAGAHIRADALRCFARWVTPEVSPRRFDTRFFVAALPDDCPVVPDGHEIVGHEWTTPAAAMAAFHGGRMPMILPTVRTLAVLEPFTTAEEAVAGLRFGDPAEPLLPEMIEQGGRSLVRLPADPEGNGALYDGETAMPAD